MQCRVRWKERNMEREGGGVVNKESRGGRKWWGITAHQTLHLSHAPQDIWEIQSTTKHLPFLFFSWLFLPILHSLLSILLYLQISLPIFPPQLTHLPSLSSSFLHLCCPDSSPHPAFSCLLLPKFLFLWIPYSFAASLHFPPCLSCLPCFLSHFCFCPTLSLSHPCLQPSILLTPSL